MQDSRETKYRENSLSRAFFTSLAVLWGSGYAKLNFDQWSTICKIHHEASVSHQSDQSVKWKIKLFGQKNILTCTREKNPFATIGLSGGLVF